MFVKIFSMSLVFLMWVSFASKASAEIMTLPSDFGTVRVYPNPWRSDRDSNQEVLFADLPSASVTTLRIFTIAGEHVQTLSGTGQIPWNVRNQSGGRLASGIYLYLLSNNHQKKTGKIAVIR